MLVALGVAWAQGSYDQAARRLCEASDLNPGDPEPYLFLGKIQRVETTQSECSGERLKRFVKLQPANALADYYYGAFLMETADGAGSRREVQRGESLLNALSSLIQSFSDGLPDGLYQERRDFSRAIASYQDSVRVSPELEEAHYRLAQAYKRTGGKGES